MSRAHTPLLNRKRIRKLLLHLVLLLIVLIIGFPLIFAFCVSTQSLPEIISGPKVAISSYLVQNYRGAWQRTNMGRLLFNSTFVALATTFGKIVMSILSAFAIVFFDFRLKSVAFWTIFITLMLPVPVRIVSTYQVISDLGWLNSYTGLIVPLIASATGTFMFRQFYQGVPGEMVEAAQIDGAGPLRFLWSILLPNSWPNIAALFVVLFIGAWNEYLWPLMITHKREMQVVVVGIRSLIPGGGDILPEWNIVMAAAIFALLVPVCVILTMQKWFVELVIEPEK
ncbi:MAG TPA: ABC transporter permease subunit [Limnochordia bacterium]|nr:ABC transporter permease subunit [Limnochordia bacterium]